MSDIRIERRREGGVVKATVRRVRRGGFTNRRRKAFLDALATTSNVAAACRAAKVSDDTVYRHKKSDPAFERDWLAALCEGYTRLELSMLERAIGGVAKLVKAPDGSTHEMREYSDRLALGLLAMHRKTVEEVRAAEVARDDMPDETQALLDRMEEMARRLADGGDD